MGICGSCYPRYLELSDFVAVVKLAIPFINTVKNVWTPDERQTLITFFTNLNVALENTTSANSELPWGSPGAAWPQNQAFREYYCRVRSSVGKTLTTAQIYSLAGQPTAGTNGGISGFNSSFGGLHQLTQQQLASFYLILGIFWSIYQGQSTAVSYLNQADELLYVYQVTTNSVIDINCSQINIFIAALSKIFFVGKSVSLPPCVVLIALNNFSVLQGSISKICVPHHPRSWGFYVTNGNPVPDSCSTWNPNISQGWNSGSGTDWNPNCGNEWNPNPCNSNPCNNNWNPNPCNSNPCNNNWNPNPCNSNPCNNNWNLNPCNPNPCNPNPCNPNPCNPNPCNSNPCNSNPCDNNWNPNSSECSGCIVIASHISESEFITLLLQRIGTPITEQSCICYTIEKGKTVSQGTCKFCRQKKEVFASSCNQHSRMAKDSSDDDMPSPLSSWNDPPYKQPYTGYRSNYHVNTPEVEDSAKTPQDPASKTVFDFLEDISKKVTR